MNGTKGDPERTRGPAVGVVEWFRPGEEAHVEEVLADLRALGVRHLRTGVSWADWHTSDGERWYEWLLPRLAREVEVLPCFTYTPPSLGVKPKTSAPPRRPRDYADFLDTMITRFGDGFEWVELWNEPNNLSDWDWRLDPEWRAFSEMVGAAANWARERGKRVALGGMAPTDPNWLRLMAKRGALDRVDAIGIHAFPGTWEFDWEGWPAKVREARRVLDGFGLSPEIWITEAGYSTWRHDEREQLRAFIEALEAPADRLYWYAAYDLHPELPHQDGFHEDERHYGFGLKRADGTPKLLYRLWESGGLEEVRGAAWLTRPAALEEARERPVLITGGSGFVGTNLAHRLLSEGVPVLLLDNLSRPGVEKNLLWLHERHGDRMHIEVKDIRDRYAFRGLLGRVRAVYHLAGQVAVTTSVESPRDDFDVNMLGTLNLLEGLRELADPPPLVFTSTNKVYGDLGRLPLAERGRRWWPDDPLVAAGGVDEGTPLDFHSPYGCSKGGADQYVLDYARQYGLPAVVFRMSCIYGPHQFGTEDQGWVAHFLIRALEGRKITLFGDGKQVRDILFVEDLVDALLLAGERARELSGEAFNIGGGPERAVSLLEIVEMIGDLQGEAPEVGFDAWRPGDQRYYVSDTGKFREATGWKPRTAVHEGVAELHRWLRETRGDLAHRRLAEARP